MAVDGPFQGPCQSHTPASKIAQESTILKHNFHFFMYGDPNMRTLLSEISSENCTILFQ